MKRKSTPPYMCAHCGRFYSTQRVQCSVCAMIGSIVDVSYDDTSKRRKVKMGGSK